VIRLALPGVNLDLALAEGGGFAVPAGAGAEMRNPARTP
jgi:hypothetical protein